MGHAYFCDNEPTIVVHGMLATWLIKALFYAHNNQHNAGVIATENNIHYTHTDTYK